MRRAARLILASALVAGAGCGLGLTTSDYVDLADAGAGGDAGAGTDVTSPSPTTDGGGQTPGADATAAGVDSGSASEGGLEAGADGGPITDPALMADWELDEGTGTVAHDRSGRGHDGTITGGTWTAGHDGRGALTLSGAAGAGVQIGLPSGDGDFDRTATTEFTMTAWVRREVDFDHDGVIAVAYQSTDGTFGLVITDPTNFDYFCGDFGSGVDDAHVAPTAVSLAVGVFHHLAIVVVPAVQSGTATVTTYFDGTFGATGTADATPRTAQSVYLGSTNYNRHMDGTIDNVRFYRRALSASDIAVDMSH